MTEKFSETEEGRRLYKFWQMSGTTIEALIEKCFKTGKEEGWIKCYDDMNKLNTKDCCPKPPTSECSCFYFGKEEARKETLEEVEKLLIEEENSKFALDSTKHFIKWFRTWHLEALKKERRI